MERLEGRVCVVTGAGQGIGLGIARKFTTEGAIVVVAELVEERGEAAAAEIREMGGTAQYMHVDVSDKTSVEGLIRNAISVHGHIDVLVNNARGATPYSRLETKTDHDFEETMQIGLYGTLWAMRAVYPSMCDNGGGRIINLISLNGVNAHPFTADYNATKEAIRALTRTAAREWGRHNILANCIAPVARSVGYETGNLAKHPELEVQTMRQLPLGRMGDPEHDIGGVALFLASDDSRFVTGMTMFADGGAHINGLTLIPDSLQ